MAKNIIHIIFDYFNDKLSNKERYALEKNLNADPFLNDALEGFAQLSKAELEHDFKIIENSLQNRIHKKKERKFIPYIGIAASIAIIIGIGSVLINKNTTKLKKETLTEDAEALTDSILLHNTLSVEVARNGLDSLDMELPDDQLAYIEEKKQSPQLKKKAKSTKLLKTKSEDKKNEIIEPAPVQMAQSIKIIEVTEETMANAEMETDAIKPPIVQEKALTQITTSQAPERIIKAAKSDINFTIKGTVIDAETKEPLPGATIYQGSQGTVSDFDGNFDFKIFDDSLIQIAYVGYKTKEISINELANSNSPIELHANQLALEEVVIVGYGNRKRSSNTGTVSTLSSSDLSGIPEPSEEVLKYKPIAIKINHEGTVDSTAYPKMHIRKFKKYLKKEFAFTSDIPCKIELEFIVLTNGSLSDIEIVESISEQFSNEAIRLIKEGPAWEAAVLNGKKIEQKIRITIKF